MLVVACVKQVPDTTQVEVDPVTGTLKREGVPFIMNPFDAHALEESLRLKDRYGFRVAVISMGPPNTEITLRRALALGVDEAVLLSDRAFGGADTLATSFVLAEAIKRLNQQDELVTVICGRQTIDGDTGQVGPELAEMLNIPFVAYVSQIEEIADGQIRVRRMIDEGYEVIQAPLPAVITVTKDINVPRLPSLRGIARSESAVIPVWNSQELGVDPARVGLSGSFTRVIKVFFPERTCQAEVFQGALEEQVECLVDRLESAGLV